MRTVRFLCLIGNTVLALTQAVKDLYFVLNCAHRQGMEMVTSVTLLSIILSRSMKPVYIIIRCHGIQRIQMIQLSKFKSELRGLREHYNGEKSLTLTCMQAAAR